jgi:hypothetical protein
MATLTTPFERYLAAQKEILNEKGAETHRLVREAQDAIGIYQEAAEYDLLRRDSATRDFVPTDAISVEQAAKTLLEEIWRLPGMPDKRAYFKDFGNLYPELLQHATPPEKVEVSVITDSATTVEVREEKVTPKYKKNAAELFREVFQPFAEKLIAEKKIIALVAAEMDAAKMNTIREQTGLGPDNLQWVSVGEKHALQSLSARIASGRVYGLVLASGSVSHSSLKMLDLSGVLVVYTYRNGVAQVRQALREIASGNIRPYARSVSEQRQEVLEEIHRKEADKLYERLSSYWQKDETAKAWIVQLSEKLKGRNEKGSYAPSDILALLDSSDEPSSRDLSRVKSVMSALGWTLRDSLYCKSL